MLAAQLVTWSDERAAKLTVDSPFFMVTGRFDAANEAVCCDYLEFLGSRLVFLIDWNKARKQLRGFLRSADRIALLQWAATSEIGHRGFLELDGAMLVNQAIRTAAGSAMQFGDRLCDVLGDAETVEFLRFAFRAASEGLIAGQSHSLIRDRVSVALARHFRNEELQLLRIAADHAGLIFELATLLRDGLQPEAGNSAKRAKRAKRFEHDADLLLAQIRDAVRRRPDFAFFVELLEAAETVANEIEEAVFLVDLVPLSGKPLAPLQSLGDLLLEATQEWIKALGHARQINRTASEADLQDFLIAIDRLSGAEHVVDEAERKTRAIALKHAEDFRQLHQISAIVSAMEAAADALNTTGAMLHGHVLRYVTYG